MPKFQVLYDVRHSNGAVFVEAENERVAREKVRKMPTSELLENTEDVYVDIERTVDVTDDE